VEGLEDLQFLGRAEEKAEVVARVPNCMRRGGGGKRAKIDIEAVFPQALWQGEVFLKALLRAGFAESLR
jgi:hypothetical protein